VTFQSNKPLVSPAKGPPGPAGSIDASGEKTRVRYTRREFNKRTMFITRRFICPIVQQRVTMVRPHAAPSWSSPPPSERGLMQMIVLNGTFISCTRGNGLMLSVIITTA
jgi:hypothetical protein